MLSELLQSPEFSTPPPPWSLVASVIVCVVLIALLIHDPRPRELQTAPVFAHTMN